jgi:hypothetical protein
MNKRTIKWEKFRNPLTVVGAEDDGERVMIRSTPFGPEALRLNPDFPSEQVYIGHTNFDIDEEVKNAIENTEGVEILEIYSSYRMRVTIGKAFNPKRIRRMIRRKLCFPNQGLQFDEGTDLKIYQETLRLKTNNKPWMMYILPNGEFESFTYDTDDELENSIMKYENVREGIGGVILSS